MNPRKSADFLFFIICAIRAICGFLILHNLRNPRKSADFLFFIICAIRAICGSLAYAEIGEDAVEDCICAGVAGDLAEGIERHAKVQGDEFGAEAVTCG